MTVEYCTLGELKVRLWPENTTPDTVNDPVLTSVIKAASREIENYTGRRFYTTAADETRYYTTECTDVCYTDDIQSITTLKTDDDGDRTYETTWTVITHYDLCPLNAALDGLPYTWIEIAPLGSYSFPTQRKAIQIVGKFGYCAATKAGDTTIPYPVREACLLSCLRMFKRKDAPFGVLGPTELGQISVIPGLDPDVKRILDQYRKVV